MGRKSSDPMPATGHAIEMPAVPELDVQYTLLRRAADVFGDAAKAESWLRTPHPLLEGHTPLQAVDHGDRDRVFELLIRIEYGIFS